LCVIFFFFLVVSLSGFHSRVMLTSWIGFERVPSISILWNTLRSIHFTYLNVWWNSAVKPSRGFSLLVDILLLIQSHHLLLVYLGFVYTLGEYVQKFVYFF
jgi:hypothetical protein